MNFLSGVAHATKRRQASARIRCEIEELMKSRQPLWWTEQCTACNSYWDPSTLRQPTSYAVPQPSPVPVLLTATPPPSF